MASALSSPRGARISALTPSSAARASTDVGEPVRSPPAAAGSDANPDSAPGPRAPPSRLRAAPRRNPSARASFTGRDGSAGHGALGDLEDRRIGDDPAARQIAFASDPFAPYRKASRAGAHRRRQLLEAAQPHPRARRIGLVQARILERRTILQHPFLAPQGPQPPGQPVGDLLEIQHIVGGVFQLFPGERTLRPVGARLTFRQRNVQAAS